MAKKVRVTQEEEIVKMLKKEGFKELSEKDIKKEPYKSIYMRHVCFKDTHKKVQNKKGTGCF